MKRLLHHPNYKWYILLLTMASYGIVIGLERMCMPVLFKEISLDLNLSTVSLGVVWGLDPLAGVVVGLVGGLLADRFGIKYTLTVVCILAGITSALRGFSNSFFTLSCTMFVFGAVAAMTPSIVPKTAFIWFKERQITMVNGFLNMSFSLGCMMATMTSATILSPWLGGWRNVLLLLGLPAVIVGFLWLFTGRDPDKSENPGNTASRVPFRLALATVIRSKEIWILSIVYLVFMGSNTGFNGYLAYYLRNIGWTPASADGLFTVYNLAFAVGVMPMVALANRLKAPRGVLFFELLITAVYMGLTSWLTGPEIWPVLIVGTFFRAGAFSIVAVLVFQAKGIGSTYGGTALGLMTSVGMLGAFIASPIGNAFEAFGAGMPFLFWAAMPLAALPLFIFLRKPKESELKAQEKAAGV